MGKFWISGYLAHKRTPETCFRRGAVALFSMYFRCKHTAPFSSETVMINRLGFLFISKLLIIDIYCDLDDKTKADESMIVVFSP